MQAETPTPAPVVCAALFRPRTFRQHHTDEIQEDRYMLYVCEPDRPAELEIGGRMRVIPIFDYVRVSEVKRLLELLYSASVC